jgi:alpha-methylacyl-CoA racemase
MVGDETVNSPESRRSGPLCDVKVVELASLAPGPFAGCLLADMGADVIRVDRIGPRPPFASDLLDRGKRSIAMDLKRPAAVGLLLDLVAGADVVIEGFRPGVTERLGVGPDDCLARNPALVYGRMTGFGQTGPLSGQAGHDIDYIALSGALSRIGRRGQPPTPPLNLVGDFGGGSLFLVFGILCALHEARRSGQGQVVDAAMVEGSGYLMMPFFGMDASSGGDGAGAERVPVERGTTILDSGAPFYDAYRTADDQWMAVGAIEPQFYAALLDGLGLDPAELPNQMDAASWPAMKERFAGVFGSRTRDEWDKVFAGTDACVAPVLDLDEVNDHPHNQARGWLESHVGGMQPGPVPRLSATPGRVGGPPPSTGEHTDRILEEWLGLDEAATGAMHRDGVVA